jgi:hypothetical protein
MVISSCKGPPANRVCSPEEHRHGQGSREADQEEEEEWTGLSSQLEVPGGSANTITQDGVRSRKLTLVMKY